MGAKGGAPNRHCEARFATRSSKCSLSKFTALDCHAALRPAGNDGGVGYFFNRSRPLIVTPARPPPIKSGAGFRDAGVRLHTTMLH